jgi:macrophage erythroblast attacher
MAELAITKLDPDSQLLLDQPLLRLPYELLRKNLKTAQRHIEQAHKTLQKDLQTAAAQSPALTLATLDATLAKAQTLKRKLEQLHVEEQSLHRQQRVRIQHLQQLHELQSLADVKYDAWSHTRLDRLLVDYILRQGSTHSAKELAEEKGIEDLVDVEVFKECGRIEKGLRAGKTQECLSWCNENKQALKKINVSPKKCRLMEGVDC